MPLCSRELRRSCASRFPPGARTRDLEHPAAVQAEEWRYDHWAPRSHVGGLGAGLGAATGPRAVEVRKEPELPQPFNNYGIVPGGNIDQTPSLQEAADKSAASATPFFLPPGNYTTSKLTLKSGTQIQGVPGASVLRLPVAVRSSPSRRP